MKLKSKQIQFNTTETYQTVESYTQFKWLEKRSIEIRVQHQAKVTQTMIISYLILNILQKPFYYKIQSKSIDVFHKCGFALALTSELMSFDYEYKTKFLIVILSIHFICILIKILSPK